MYQQRYAEIIEDDQAQARRVEARALDHAVTLLKRAADRPASANEGVEALDFIRHLWTTFIAELASPENALPQQLRAKLISIGIWILKEADAIRLAQSRNYGGIAEVCTIVRDGLQ